MSVSLYEKIREFSADMELPGKYLANICQEYSAIVIEQEISAALQSKRYDTFTAGLDFLEFLYNSEHYIPGDYEKPVIAHIDSTHTIEGLISNELISGYYPKCLHYLYMYARLPNPGGSRAMDDFSKRFISDEPLLTKDAVNCLMKLGGDVFPAKYYDSIKYEDRDIEVIVKYNIIEYSNIDSVMKQSLFESLANVESIYSGIIKDKCKKWTMINNQEFVDETDDHNQIDELINNFLDEAIENMEHGKKLNFFGFALAQIG